MSRSTALFVSAILFAASAPVAAQNTLPVNSADHRGVWTEAQVTWTSRYDPEYLPSPHGPWRIELALPLPPDAVVESTDAEVEVVRDPDRRIVAIDLSAPASRQLVPTTLTTSMASDGAIDPPLPVGVVQRLVMTGAKVRPPPGSPLQLRLLDVRHASLSTTDRWQLRERWGPPDSARPVVLLADETYAESGGLASSVEPASSAAALGALGAALIALVVMLLLGLKLASRYVRAEEADAFLRRHDAALSEDLSRVG